jgi:large subunit ribosomal protein L13
MKTYSPKPEHIERRWYVLDAGDKVLGRVASEAAVILRGKHKPIFAPHMDVGDNLIIINAAKVVLTGGKEMKKVAWRHSGHPGGITGTLYADLLEKKPAFAVEKAVRGMLPKNRLGRAMIKKLHVVAGPEHHHQAQKPVDWTMGMRPVWEGLPVSAAPVANGKKRGKSKEAAETPTTAEKPAEETATKQPAASKETTARKTAAKPATRAKATTSKTTRAKATTRKPTAAKTAAKKPAAKKPAAKKPAAKKPAAKKPAAKKKES